MENIFLCSPPQTVYYLFLFPILMRCDDATASDDDLELSVN